MRAVRTGAAAISMALLPGSASAAGMKASQNSQKAPVEPLERDHAALTEFDRQWLTPYKTRDRAALESILASDFVTLRADDRVPSRDQFLNSPFASDRVIDSIPWDHLKIHVFGDLAVVTGKSTLKGRQGDRAAGGNNEYADIYVRRKKSGRRRGTCDQIARSELTGR